VRRALSKGKSRGVERVRRLAWISVVALASITNITACVVEVILGLKVNSVRGVVRNANNAKPITGAEVELWTTRSSDKVGSTCESCSIKPDQIDSAAKREPVLIQTDQTQTLVAKTTTDVDGNFEIAKIEDGKYEIVFRTPIGARSTFIQLAQSRGSKDFVQADITSWYGGPACASIRKSRP
jgi:hypothetical protein